MNHLVLCLLTLLSANDISHVDELGPVRVSTTLSPAQPTIGDEVVLTIQVRAESGVDVLMPEFGEALSRYTILDFVPKQRVEDNGATTYSQRYTLQPYLSGKQSIPPILIEFVDHRPGQKPAPEDMDAYEILTDRLDFEVQSVLPADTVPELNPPLGKLELPTDPGTRRRQYLALGGVTAALLLSVVLWRCGERGGAAFCGAIPMMSPVSGWKNCSPDADQRRRRRSRLSMSSSRPSSGAIWKIGSCCAPGTDDRRVSERGRHIGRAVARTPTAAARFPASS